jgi:hypothetical protein
MSLPTRAATIDDTMSNAFPILGFARPIALAVLPGKLA